MASVPKPSSLASIRDIDRLSSSPAFQRQSLLSSTRPASIPANPRPYGSPTQPTADPAGPVNSPNLMDLLQRSEQSIVKTRTGSVLSRGFILKTDHYPSGMSPSPLRPLVLLAHASFQAEHLIWNSTSMVPQTLEDLATEISTFLVLRNLERKDFEQSYPSFDANPTPRINRMLSGSLPGRNQ